MANPAEEENTTSTQKFNASLSFSHEPPYDLLFAERVPVLLAFQFALANYTRELARVNKSVWAQLSKLFHGSAHPFQAAECGVYTGSSLLACASMARDSFLPFRIIGLDTFTGLPPLSDMDLSLAPRGARYVTNQMFGDTSLESVHEKLLQARVADCVELRKGLFRETLPTLPDQRYHFVNIDCDLYEPHIECLEYFYPRMASDGIVFFDDYHSVEYPMAGRAVDDFMRDKPEHLLHLRFGEDGANRTKSFFLKY
jgi:O-methyltransferase